MERERIGPYRIVRPLGQGGMGAVYLVERDGRSYALKVLLPGAAEPEDWLRFQRESDLLRALEHPGIVRWVESGVDGETPYVVMEAVDGGSLADRIARQGALPVEQVLELGSRLAEALAYAHQAGVIHRDLKPANVLLGRDGPKLSDFGLATLQFGVSRLTRSGDVLGSPAFMAPEQAEGRRRDQGIWTDIYGLGALLYHALTGRPPFQHAQVLELLRQVSTQPPTPPSRLRPGLDPELDRLISSCLAKDPCHRPPSAGAVGEALATLRRSPAAPVRRARLAPALAVAVLGLGAAVAVGVLAGTEREREPEPAGSPPAVRGDPGPTPEGDAELARLEAALRELIEAGRFAEGEALARERVATWPDSAMLWRAVSVCAVQQGRPEDGLAAAVRATELAPDDPAAWALRASQESNLGDMEAGLASSRRAIDLDPDSPRAWIHRGTALAHLGRNEDALEAYDRALALDPDDAWVRANRATVRWRLGDAQGALDDLDRDLSTHPDDVEARKLRAQALRRLGRREEALAELGRVVADGPDAESCRYLAVWRLEAGDRAGAGQAAALGLRLDASDSRLWRLAALASRDLAQVDAHLSRAIELDPAFGEAWRERGVCRAQAGRLEEALADLDRAVTLRPRDPTGRFNRALVRRDVGALEGALDDLRAVIEQEPANPDPLFHAASCARRLERLEEALDFVDRGLSRLPTLAPGHAERAMILLALGRGEQAEQAARRAIALEPDHPLREEWERLAETARDR